MTTADTEAMTAVRALLDERQRYEGWIQGLDAHRDSAAAHVYERVRGDYARRLAGVIERLTEHAEQLRSTVDVLASRQQQLRAREADRQEARQEAELRAAVGEFTEEEWSGLRDEADLEIALIVEEREGVESELTELQRIMQLTSAAPETSAASVQDSSDAVAVAAQESEGELASSSGRPNAGQSARNPILASKPGDDAGQSIEDFVADWPVQHVAEGSATAHATPAQANHAHQNDADRGVIQNRVPSGPNNGGRQSVPPQGTPLFSAPAVDGTASHEPATEMRREQEKTLKCPECGALNYATEWYCERCGGELATY